MIYTLENVIKSRTQGAGYCLHIKHLQIAPGEQLALTGQSGSGKSTALDLLGMVLQPDSAQCFRFNALPAASDTGTDVAALWQQRRLDAMTRLRLQHMGYVLQTGGLLPYLSVAENMGLTARMQGQSPERVKESVQDLAAQLGIATLLSSLPATLSVGERQRVAIGRALTPRPAVVLADEPTAALDPIHSQKVMALFAHAVRSLGATLIMVSHDLELVRRCGLREVRVDVHAQEDGGVLALIDDQGAAKKEAGHA